MVAIHNIDDEEFVFQYDASKGGLPYVIPAGEVKRLPRFLANHALKHLIDKLITKDNKPGIGIANMDARRDYMQQIVVGEEVLETTAPRTEAEQVKDAIDLANKPSELDRILDKKRLEEKKAEEVVADVPKPKEDIREEFDQLKKEKPGPKPKPEVPSLPTRGELFKFATEKMGMVLDKKTRIRLSKMRVPELIKEFNYPQDD